MNSLWNSDEFTTVNSLWNSAELAEVQAEFHAAVATHARCCCCTLFECDCYTTLTTLRLITASPRAFALLFFFSRYPRALDSAARTRRPAALLGRTVLQAGAAERWLESGRGVRCLNAQVAYNAFRLSAGAQTSCRSLSTRVKRRCARRRAARRSRRAAGKRQDSRCSLKQRTQGATAGHVGGLDAPERCSQRVAARP